jgi:hypothetical protein
LTSEGIKNNTKDDEELKNDKRLRMPRPFYEIEKMIREYDDYHAFWLNLVPRLNRGINTEQFYEACLVDSKRDESITVLFLSHD